MKFQQVSRILAVLAFAAAAGSAVAATNDVLTSKTGMTIYTFDKDANGKSSCNASCLAVWPAVPAAEAPSTDRDFGSIEREDGTKQLTHKNRPVYYYIQDRKPGDVTGDKVGNVWHVIPRNAKSANAAKKSYSSGGYSDAYSSSY